MKRAPRAACRSWLDSDKRNETATTSESDLRGQVSLSTEITWIIFVWHDMRTLMLCDALTPAGREKKNKLSITVIRTRGLCEEKQRECCFHQVDRCLVDLYAWFNWWICAACGTGWFTAQRTWFSATSWEYISEKKYTTCPFILFRSLKCISVRQMR